MKSIMISIQPQWVEKILNREKTIEIRKTMPKCEFPCKVYIYCTKGKYKIFKTLHGIEHNGIYAGYLLNGNVVAEFTLNGVVKFDIKSIMFLGKQQELMQKSKLGGLSLRKYIGDGIGYAWHIDNLKIYNEPKELSEFVLPNKKNCKTCFLYPNMCNKVCEETKQHLFRPPQRWCYVEDLDEN